MAKVEKRTPARKARVKAVPRVRRLLAHEVELLRRVHVPERLRGVH